MTIRHVTAEEIYQFWQDNEQNYSHTAKHFGISRTTVRNRINTLDDAPQPEVGGQVERLIQASSNDGRTRRFLFTSAQNNTWIHEEFVRNLEAFASFLDAQIIVGTFTYNMNAYGRMSVKKGTAKRQEELWYDERICSYILDSRFAVCNRLLWCGEQNILPTAILPLSGLGDYAGRASTIFPHAKIAMESVASGKYEGTKLMFTTGACTLRNYIHKKSGLRADPLHAYGALLVEIDDSGSWFCRQIQADDSGTFYDLDRKVENGKITDGHRVEAVNWGDLHVAKIEEEQVRIMEDMLDSLSPRHQFMHDIFDHYARNHHEVKNHHAMFRRHVGATDSVEDEVKSVALFLQRVERAYCDTVVVASNHDDALTRWLRDADYRYDPQNALFFLEAQLECYKAIARGETFAALPWACYRAQCPEGVRFLSPDESFIVCKTESDDGIECGMHGHLGVDGARGNARAFARMGRKANVGHSHSARITDGVYVAGVTGSLDMGYNQGPSTWSHSHILTYQNGSRCIVTAWRGKWRA